MCNTFVWNAIDSSFQAPHAPRIRPRRGDLIVLNKIDPKILNIGIGIIILCIQQHDILVVAAVYVDVVGGNTFLIQVIKYPLVLLLPTEPGEQQVVTFRFFRFLRFLEESSSWWFLDALAPSSSWLSNWFCGVLAKFIASSSSTPSSWQWFRWPPNGELTLPHSSQAASRWQCFRSHTAKNKNYFSQSSSH